MSKKRKKRQPRQVHAETRAPSAPAVAWRTWACVAALLIATLIAFSPAFNAGFVKWDDPRYVAENALLDDAAGLREIWNPDSVRLPQGGLQYYPLVFTSFWLERRLWQDDARGYHATNVLLHLLNAVLAFLLVRNLGAPLWIAGGAAGIFALHPVQVASVVWVSERKNVLSGSFYLAAFLLYLRHRTGGRLGPYVLALLAFGAALLCKTQAATLPVSIALCEWLVLPATRLARRIPWPDVALRLAPMVVLAFMAAGVTARIERQVIASYYVLPEAIERPFVAANAAWFYIGKFLIPAGISPLYPKWDIELRDPLWWLGLLAWPLAVAMIVRWRRRIGPLILFGAAMFLVSVGPALGLVTFAYQYRSLVADHFLYLSCLGGGIALAALAHRLAGGAKERRYLVGAVGVALLVFYGVSTYRESLHWHDNYTFWRHAFERAPDSYPPNINLALHYASTGDKVQAVEFYRRASGIRPANTPALDGYLRTLAATEGPQAVIEACNEKLRQDAKVEYVLYLHRAASYEALGRPKEALADYERVLHLTRRGSNPWRRARQARERLRQAPRGG